MNTAQRRLVLAALAALAVALHVWHYDYRIREETVLASEPGSATLWWTYTHEPDSAWLPERLERVRQHRERAELLAKTSWGTSKEERERLQWEAREAMKPRPGESVQWRLDIHVEPTWGEDESFLWGALGPLAVFCIAVFMILGWRRPKVTGGNDGGSTTAGA